MSGFGTELLLICGLGYVILGPKRMHAILQHIARAKAEFERTQQQIKSQLATELGAETKDPSA
jgi:Sec-independent protein translocase protein TatA